MEIQAQPSSSQPLPRPATQRWLMWAVIVVAAAILGVWLWKTPEGIQGKADAIGYAICHRIGERSFASDGRQLPLCARCTGIYAGAMTGLAVIFATGRSKVSRFPGWKICLVLASFVAILGIDGINSYLHLFPNFEGGLYEPSNTLRLITGVFCGLTLIHAFYPIFNSSVWQQQDRRSAIANFKELALYCVAGAITAAAILTQNALILLIFGLVSAFGVLLILAMMNSVMFIAITRSDHTYQSWRELWLPFLAGLTVALVLIGGIDALRYMLTGTWDGFVFAQK